MPDGPAVPELLRAGRLRRGANGVGTDGVAADCISFSTGDFLDVFRCRMSSTDGIGIPRPQPQKFSELVFLMKFS